MVRIVEDLFEGIDETQVCRPFAAAIGDRRPARQVLADGRADAAETVAALAGTPDGRRRLSALAAAIEERLRGTSPSVPDARTAIVCSESN